MLLHSRVRRARRGLHVAALGLALASLATTLPAQPAQAADPVAEAQSIVRAMNAKVERVTAQLVAGEERYAKGSRELTAVRRKAAAARRSAAAAEQVAGASRTRLREFAAAAYRNPVPSTLLQTLGASGQDGFRDSVLAAADLEQVRGSQEDVLAGLLGDQIRAQTSVQAAAGLEADAAKREQILKAQLDALRDLAVKTDQELQAANAKLTRLVDARKAAAARRASRSRGGIIASCSGKPIGGYSNGNIPPEALCPLKYAPGESLRSDAAKAFNAMTEASKASRGTPLCVSDSYRSYSDQVAVYREKPGLAATPGTSNHGWGVAVDFCGGVERFGSEAHEWMRANAGRFGWIHPSWARQGGSKPEPWHWEYVG
ncbi:MAG: M15 family metallopeptidase [Mycobacteriales bacterium]|nr:M15 family metallopeptidase [Mycobacteriales bacterium]